MAKPRTRRQYSGKNQNKERQERNRERIRKLFVYFSLFQYSTKCERIFIALAILLAIVSACIPPLINVLYGEFCNMLIDRQFPSNSSSTKTTVLAWFGGGKILQNASNEERRVALEEDSKAWGIGCASFTLLQFIFSLLSVFLLCLTASRQMCRIKILFFKSTICKDMAWFDSQMDGNFAGRASENLFLIERGIADLLSVITFQLVVGVINIVICFLRSWILSLILLMVIIPMILSVFIKLKFQSRLSEGEMQYFAKAGSVAEEVFTSIRTVAAFGGEKKEVDRYLQHLKGSRANGIRKGVVAGISSGIVWFIIYSSYAIAFFLGTRLALTSRENKDEKFSPADLIIVLFGMLTGLTNFGYAAGHFETISVACGAAASVFNVINSTPKINPCLNVGYTLEVCKGEIEFRNVHFEYPSRSSIKILNGINLKIKAGEKVAIVGGSGTGKSTILQLLQRLYDPSEGEVLLDGHNIKTLQVSWLRGQMGVVSQEPLLFATTIGENIAFGFPPATEAEIEDAARKANAHSFIISLKDKYNTVIGQRGSTLSGGQKQRIAIARALVRKPKILLLDEATSALDTASEKLVQEALDRASRDRTTLIVTHRLSTITNADRIVVLNNGLLAEEGTHEELLRINGIYTRLLNSQSANIKEKKRQKIEIPKNPVIYEDEAVFPPGRFSSASIYSTHPRALDFPFLERLERFKKSSYLDIMKWSKPERFFLVCGSVASIIGGTALPTVCVLLGSLFGLFSSTDSHFILERTDLYSSLLVMIGIVSGVCVFLQTYCFSVAALQLSTRIRVKYFESMIHQEIPWFENDENRVGVLCLRLSQDASEMQRAVGTHIGILLQALSTLLIGTILCFFFNWKITLVTILTIPFVFAGVYIETIFAGGFGDVKNKSSEKAARIAVEVISNIKAVSSLGNESYFIEKYRIATKEERKVNVLKACMRGLSFAAGQTVPFFGYAIALWYGGLLVARENLHYQYVIMVTEILIFGAWTLGQSVIFTPNFGETKAAVGRLKYIFLRKSRISDGKITSDPEFDSKSFIKYSRVGFSYPTDPAAEVLRNFNLVVRSGESVAIMGPSGSGKSTIIQLLLRFYIPTFGAIYINNVNIEEYKLSSLRKLLGLVSQEPVLFNRTIKENIAYGDNSREVPLDEIIQAAEAANIHSFIESLPFGYDTTLGTGTQLSGGQKQRIAIARVLVRKPQIILLDEATSALDPESEGIVQDALDSASSGRTTITIAHRFSAARNADIIYVMEKGSIIESGTHQELMKVKGLYYSMYGEAIK